MYSFQDWVSLLDTISILIYSFPFNDNKQLLDESEHDIKNYPHRGQCYLPKPKAEEDNIDRDLDNSWYYV